MSAGTPPRIYTLPLFPLNCVLFPQFPLQLHIFEERYREMIDGCIENNAPFGVVLIREGEEIGAPAHPHGVGCVARILAVKRLEDGGMNLWAAGEERFRVLDYMSGDTPYLMGRVEEMDDAADETGESQTLALELSALFVRYLELLARQVEIPMPEIELPDDPTLLAFCVASVSMLPLLDKQSMLEMTDPYERIATELIWLREQIREMEAGRANADDRRFETEEEEANEIELEGDDTPRVVFAMPLDITSEPWRRYQHEIRN